ncbi:hypothetical protein [Paenibacillus lutrae]|uniref:Terminase n=1 Tax=Paenibacillus lutrae TaxID=2078573 RepID=A0A7X3FIN2_9BACL|nr:hypothetical protein [Paenibacillus lutrae]MVP00356.1 hypothetical protein [Paenibacillus lutrae]
MITAKQIVEKRKELWESKKSITQDGEFTQAAVDYLLENEHIRIEIARYPERLVEMFFVIVDKNQETVPFFLNKVQQDFVDDLNQAIDDYNAGKRLHLNFLVLKGRQQGFTTVITAYQLACAITKRNFSGITIADINNNTNTIFEKKAKFPYSRLPEPIMPTQKYNNRREFMFDRLNSSWVVDTAGNKDVGRSNTINFFHGSEVAFWDSISSILTGLGEALTKNSIKILESTANGYNEFKDLWDGAGKNTWEAKFYYWFDTPEYENRFENAEIECDFKRKVLNEEGSGDQEREVIKKIKSLLNEVLIAKFGEESAWKKVYWYYQKWSGYIDKELIKQEYPCNPREAFLATGRCVFDKEIITNRIEYLTNLYKDNPPKRGYFTFDWNDPGTKDKIVKESIKWVDNSQGYITIYEEVQPRTTYTLGGDTKGEGSDFYSGVVINHITGKRAAYLHANLDPDTYTHQLFCMGMHYNKALIGVEINFDRYPVIELERLKYPKQYVRERYDTYTHQITKMFGWKTDGNTRPLIIDKQTVLFRDNIDLFPDITMLDEGLTFVYDKNNRPDAQPGKHDDLLFGDMIANEIRSQQTIMSDEMTVDVSKLPADLQEDWNRANPEQKKYLAQKWGLTKGA